MRANKETAIGALAPKPRALVVVFSCFGNLLVKVFFSIDTILLLKNLKVNLLNQNTSSSRL